MDDQGEHGEKGETGGQGIQGPPGKVGTQGIQGFQGIQGVQGMPGDSNTSELMETAVRQVGILVRQSRQNRFWRRFAVVTSVVALASALVIAFLGNQLYRTEEAVHNAQVVSCERSNVNRHNNLAMWTTVLNYFGSPLKGQTAAKNASRAALKKSLQPIANSVFVPQNCASIYKEDSP
jgi:hypothetical protein